MGDRSPRSKHRDHLQKKAAKAKDKAASDARTKQDKHGLLDNVRQKVTK